MATSYKSFGSSANLFMPSSEARRATYRRSYPKLYEVFDTVNFELSRPYITPIINEYLRPKNALGKPRCLSNRGRPGVDPVLMFQICFIQWSLGKTDDQMENLLNTDLALRYLLDFELDCLLCRAPDAKTIWKYREIFIKSGLFVAFNMGIMNYLSTLPEVVNDPARCIDSSFALMKVQHNTKKENEIIKAGKGDALWQDQPNKKRQKDTSARWTKKGGINFFGYKLHAKISASTKYILSAVITPANVHDSQVIAPLLNSSDAGKVLFADSGYCGELQELIARRFQMTPCFCMRAYRGKELTEEQKQENRQRSSIRCRVEHPFAFIEKSMGAADLRSVGIDRATGLQHLTVLVYNLHRYCQLNRGRAEMRITSRLTCQGEVPQRE